MSPILKRLTLFLNIFASGELNKDSVSEESSATAADGKVYKMRFYNLDAIISVGYRVNSICATQFRQWATNVLKTFAVQGYVLDKQRLENGQIFDEAYFDHLIDEIRASEHLQKVSLKNIVLFKIVYINPTLINSFS